MSAIFRVGTCRGTPQDNPHIFFLFSASGSLGGNQNHVARASARVFHCPSAHLFALPYTDVSLYK
jgi:hypothetical protein